MQGRAQAMDDGGGEEAQYVFGHIERHEYLQQAVRFPNTTQPCVSLPRCEHVRLRKKQSCCMFSTACLVPHLCCSSLSLLWGATATAASWAGWLAPLVSEGAIIWFCSRVLLLSWSLGLLLLGLGESQRRPLCSHQLEQCDGKGIPTARHFDRVQWLFAKHPP